MSGLDPDSFPAGQFLLDNYGARRLHIRPQSWLGLHWIQMLPPQMFVSLLMEYNPSSCSCCLFGKSQPLTALILNQGSVGRLLSKGAWKIMKKTLSTDSTLADLHFPRKLSWVLHIKKKGWKITVLERFCVTSGLQVFFFLFFYRVLCWGKKNGNLNQDICNKSSKSFLTLYKTHISI